MKDQALQRFVDAFGNIDGNTLQSWQGWTASARLVKSGQIQTTYIGPDKSRHGTIKSAQVWLGHRLLEGEDLAGEHADAVAKASTLGTGNQARQAIMSELASAGISRSEGIKMTLSDEGTLTTASDAPQAETPRPPLARSPRLAAAKAPRLVAAGKYREASSLAIV